MMMMHWQVKLEMELKEVSAHWEAEDELSIRITLISLYPGSYPQQTFCFYSMFCNILGAELCCVHLFNRL